MPEAGLGRLLPGSPAAQQRGWGVLLLIQGGWQGSSCWYCRQKG